MKQNLQGALQQLQSSNEQLKASLIFGVANKLICRAMDSTAEYLGGNGNPNEVIDVCEIMIKKNMCFTMYYL